MAATTTKARTFLRLEGAPSALGTLRVLRFTADEELNVPGEVCIEAVPADPEGAPDPAAVVPDALAAFPAMALSMTLGRDLGGGVRRFAGRLAEVAVERVGGVACPYSLILTLRPDLWFLSLTSRPRVLRALTTRQIVDGLLAEHHVAVDWRTSPAYNPPPRPSCLAFEETDLEQFQRLLEEDGLSYYHESTEQGARLVITDTPGGQGAAAGGGKPVALLPPLEVRSRVDARLDAISGARQVYRATAASYTHRTPDPDDPTATVEAKAIGRGGARRGEVVGTDGRDVGREEARRLATARAATLDAASSTCAGTGHVRTFAPGRLVRLAGAAPGTSQVVLLTRVRHDGTQGRRARYSNEFEGVASGRPYAPARATARPVAPGALAAIAVTPPDANDAVTVRFDADPDQAESARIPLAHPFDARFAPRPGDRVRVDFLAGDLDRPVVVDRLTPPSALPFDPDRSPGRGGVTTLKHRLWFDDEGDRPGCLQEVGGRFDRHVTGDATTITLGDEARHVAGDQHESVRGDGIRSFGGGYALHAGGRLILGAGESIVITAGGSAIVIDASGITINGKPMLSLNPPGGAPAPRPPKARDVHIALPKRPARAAKNSNRRT